MPSRCVPDGITEYPEEPCRHDAHLGHGETCRVCADDWDECEDCHGQFERGEPPPDYDTETGEVIDQAPAGRDSGTWDEQRYLDEFDEVAEQCKTVGELDAVAKSATTKLTDSGKKKARVIYKDHVRRISGGAP